MTSYVDITLKEAVTFVTLSAEVKAKRVAITATFGAPTDIVFILSDIVYPQHFNENLKPIIGHIPTVQNCFRDLTVKKFSRFIIRLENVEGQEYKPAKPFIIELKFDNGDHV